MLVSTVSGDFSEPIETLEAQVSYSEQWPQELQEILLRRGVNDYIVRDRRGWDVLGPQPRSYTTEHFPLRVLIREREDAEKCVSEATVIKYEEAILKLRSLGASGAGRVEEGLDDFSVAFGGGGVRSGAFCTGVLWALAETNRLSQVTHLSSVSGGSVAASGFASFLVEACKERPASYREVVADFIERSQRNAGYLVSFDNLFQVPEDNSSSHSRIWDLPLMILVILGVLVAAPTVFCVFYLVPVTLLIEAYWGGALRDCFCRQSLEDRCNLVTVLQPHGSLIFWIMSGLVVILVILALIYQCCGIEAVRHSPNPRWFLHWRSMTHLCTRWLVMFMMVLATVELVYFAELRDHERPSGEQCANYWNKGPLCSDVLLGLHVLNDGNDFVVEEAETFTALGHLAGVVPAVPDPVPDPKDLPDQAPGEPHPPGFVVTFLLVTLGFGLVALSFKLLGWRGLWQAFLLILLPLWFIWPASFLLQWRVFGPITGQALFTPFLDTQIFGHYSDRAWFYFTSSSLILAIAGLPAFNLLHRFVHYYFRVSLQRAFYLNGEDVSMPDVAACPSVPILLFGATLNEFQRPQSKEAHSHFTLTQYAMGCQRTDFLAAPRWMSLARCMTLSCAAIDGFVLTQINKWHTRVLMALLNLTQGDWLRFDRSQKWPSRRWPELLKQPHLASLFDRLPEMILFAFIYLFCMLANNQSRAKGTEHLVQDCEIFGFFTAMAMGLIAVFIGIFSFFGHVRWLNWLLESPVIRQIHMFLMFHECMEKPPMYLYLTDGGPVEDLGLVPLLRRRRRWILSFDVGDDPTCELLDLRAAIALARKERLCSFYLHRDARLDLEDVLEDFRNSNDPFLHLGVLYSDEAGRRDRVGEIFHVRMRLLDDSVPVQPLVQREEVILSERGVFSVNRVTPVQAVELQPMPEDMSSQTSDSSGSRPLKRRSELGGICCECCHDGRECRLCGAFPHTHTVNQFFTPTVWANFCRLGREMAAPAIAELTKAQMHERRASARAHGF